MKSVIILGFLLSAIQFAQANDSQETVSSAPIVTPQSAINAAPLTTTATVLSDKPGASIEIPNSTQNLLLQADGTATNAKSPWSTSMFILTAADVPVLDQGAASLGGNGYVSLNYRISKEQRFSIRPQFNYNTAGFNKYGDNLSSDMTAGDIYLQYSDYVLYNSGILSIAGDQRLYIPTSQFSKDSKMITRLRSELYSELGINRNSSLTYVVKFDYYVQSQRAYLNSTTKLREDGTYVTDPRSGNREAFLDHYLEYNNDLNKTFSLQPQLGFEDEWRYGSETEKIDSFHGTSLKAALGLAVRVHRQFDFILSFQNKALLGTNYAFGRPKDNNLAMLSYFRF